MKQKLLSLKAWGDQTFEPPLSRYQLLQLVKRGQIDPPAVFIGRGYCVREDAVVVDDQVSAEPVQRTHDDPVIARILANR